MCSLGSPCFAALITGFDDNKDGSDFGNSHIGMFSIFCTARSTRRINGPTRRSTKGGWTEVEDKILTVAVKKYNGKNWKKIAANFSNRTDVQCMHRWQKVLDPSLIEGNWTKTEDDLIIELVGKQKGEKRKWSEIAKRLQGRIGKQCRERWHNLLDPRINKTAWTEDEEAILNEMLLFRWHNHL